MKRADGYIVFHENGKGFMWHIVSGKVYRYIGGSVVASNCYNMETARARVRGL
jgi:hypothetical protein